jgi:hypothetical protein
VRLVVREETTAGGRAEARVVRLAGERTTLRELLRARAELPHAGGFAAAVEAFERGRLLVLVDGRQRVSLDEAVELSPASDVAFVRLVPLAGG